MDLGPLTPLTVAASAMNDDELERAVLQALDQARPTTLVCMHDSCARRRRGVPVRATWLSVAELRGDDDERWVRHSHPFCPRCSQPADAAERPRGEWIADHHRLELDP